MSPLQEKYLQKMKQDLPLNLGHLIALVKTGAITKGDATITDTRAVNNRDSKEEL
jgi:hypothetical protein